MSNPNKLALVKTIHTLIWVFYNGVILYLVYASIYNKMDCWFWACWGFVLLEGIVLLLFKFICPLTLIARRYSDDPKENFDIYLPEWLARHTKLIYTSIVIIIMLITVFRLL